MSTLPTYEQIQDIPAQLVRSVPLEYIDENGHMNIGRYLELGGTALWQRCQRELGMPEDYIATRGMSTFTAEHHLTYLSEMLEGEQTSVHVRLVARSDKALHTVSLIVNESQRRLSCVMEATLVHMNMIERRPTPFPDDVTALLDAALKHDDDIAWAAPLSGSMGVRRSA